MNTSEWIKPYRDTLEQQYRLDSAAQQEVDEFFGRLEQMASTCKDPAEFTNQFMQGPMFKEYNGFFTKFQKMAVTASGETVEEAVKTMQKENRESSAKEYAKDMASREAKIAISQMLPDEVNRLRWGGARTLPVIGPIIQWIDNFKWFRRMFNKD